MKWPRLGYGHASALVLSGTRWFSSCLGSVTTCSVYILASNSVLQLEQSLVRQ